jgi:hypothetical protein
MLMPFLVISIVQLFDPFMKIAHDFTLALFNNGTITVSQFEGWGTPTKEALAATERAFENNPVSESDFNV